MIEKSTIEKVLEIFFEHPESEFYLRELSRKLKLSMPTIVSATDKLSKEGLIIKTKGKALTIVTPNRENHDFIRKKRVFNLEKLYNSGILDCLIPKYNNPKLIILFGSYSRGEDTEKSDVDIALITSKKMDLSLKIYEKELKRPINIHELNLEKISQDFRANLCNGIVLEGSW